MKLFKDDGSGRMLRILLILMGAFFVMMIVSASMAAWIGGYFTPGSRSCYLSQSVVQALVGFIGTSVLTVKLATPHPWRFLGLVERVNWRPFLGVVLVYILALPFLNQLIYYNSLMSFPESLSSLEQSMREMEEINGKFTKVILGGESVGALVSGILIIGVLTGLAEEMLFRGTLQRTIAIYRPMGQWAIWIAAFIFSAVHMQFFGFFPRLLLGAFFGYMLYSTGSLWPGVFAHALNNSLVVVTSWLQPRSPEMPDLESFGTVKEGFPVWGVVSLVATGLFLLFFYKSFFFKVSKKNSPCYGHQDSIA